MNKESVSLWADIKKYEDMLAADPKSYCFTLLSELYRKLGLLDDAINVAKRGIEAHPEYIGGYVAIGRAYFEKGMKEESINALEKVVQVTPENILAQKLLSQMYIERGEVESAIKSLNVIGLLNPEDVESRLMLEALKKPAARDEVMVDFDADAELASGEEVAPDEEGFVFIDEIQEAELPEEQAEYVHELQDTEAFPEKGPLATATLAELYVSQGFLDQAINVYRELLEKEPDNGRFRERLIELECLLAGPEIESAMQGGEVPEENPDTSVIESPSDYLKEKHEFASDTGNSDVIISTLEHWLENIRRGRYGAERDAQRYS
jgi:tetratricopeptide (TPR) repeat protein